MGINRVTISGNLTRDPELRTTPAGTSVLQLGVAVNDRRKNAQGEWEDVANFVDCTLFGARATALQPYLSKGTKVAIEGKLHYHQWEAQDGTKRSKLDVTVEEIELMARDGQQQQRQPAPQQQAYQQPQAYQQQPIPQPQAYAVPQGYQPAPQPYVAPPDGVFAQKLAARQQAQAQQPLTFAGVPVVMQPVADAYADEDIPF